MSKQTCTVIKMDFRDIDRAAEDPKLAALLADGWTVASSLAIEDQQRMAWVLLLQPPQPKTARRVMPDVLLGVALVLSLVSLVASVLLPFLP